MPHISVGYTFSGAPASQPIGREPAGRGLSAYLRGTHSVDVAEIRLGALYSHSRLSSFENCPKQFEFRYVLKIPSESESIEAFVGKHVHEILERLYLFVGRGQVPGVEKVVERYYKLWDETYDPERVRIIREGTPLDFYRKLGETCLRGYYMRHYPFDEAETLGIEKRVIFPLDEAGEYKMQGIIDRVSRARDGVIEVHDYKTGARVPSQKIVDQDRQLALYQIGLTRQYGDDQPFRLVWHYVAKNQVRVSTRTPEELTKLRRATIARIDEIQTASEYPAKKIALCPWCEYKNRCPLWVSKEEAEAAAAAHREAAAAAKRSDGHARDDATERKTSTRSESSEPTQSDGQLNLL